MNLDRATNDDLKLREQLRGHYRRLEDDYALEAIIEYREKILSAPVASDARELAADIVDDVTTEIQGAIGRTTAKIERFVAERERKAREEIAALRACIKTMDDNRMWPDEVHGVATTALSDARESAEPAEVRTVKDSLTVPTDERRPEVDALLWMTERLMGLSAASTMRGWLAEYRAAGRLAVRNASGATIGQYPEEATR